MADKKVVKEWLNSADEDFEFASVNLEEGDRFFSRICFHFQQAGEKYLKAFIVANDLPFKKIHDLTQLIEICKKKDEFFETLQNEAKFLTDLYIDTRYPAFWPIGQTREEAEKAKASAKQIGDFIKEKLK